MKYALVLEDMPESQELLKEVAQAAFPGIESHCAADVAGALRLLDAGTSYDLGLIDLALPDGDGTTVIQAMARRLPQCMIVVASLFDDDDHLFPALRAGARGYLLKDQAPELLCRQLQGIRQGQPPLSPAVARRLLAHFRVDTAGADDHASGQEADAAGQPPLLTPREREVLTCLARGISIGSIGAELGISRHTAGDHVKNIYRKLNISSRAQAALEAQNLGLLGNSGA
jgi:DNA-binding NarL/FixJ family response regulator